MLMTFTCHFLPFTFNLRADGRAAVAEALSTRKPTFSINFFWLKWNEREKETNQNEAVRRLLPTSFIFFIDDMGTVRITKTKESGLIISISFFHP